MSFIVISRCIVLCHSTSNSSDYTASNGRVINKSQTATHIEVMNSGLIWSVIPAFSCKYEVMRSPTSSQVTALP